MLELVLGGVLERSWDGFGGVLGCLGVSWGRLGASWGRLGGGLGVLACLGGGYGEFWVVLVAFWKGLGRLWGPLGVSWDVLKRFKTD